jgi:hypothetical protein
VNRDFRDLLAEFNVEYLVVGAHALAAHGHVRATKDLDLWARPASDNAARRRQQEVTMSKSFQPSLAPHKLWQAINPWSFFQQGAQFGLINIELGQTPRPDVEQAILDKVGSYGRQLGRIGDAVEVLLKLAKRDGLSQAEKDALDVLQGQLAEVRQVKKSIPTDASTST